MTRHSPLFRLETDAERQPKPAAVLLVSLEGFLDAGQVRSTVAEHLLDTLEHEVVASFEVDELIDYRSRRPLMTFDSDHYASYDDPALILYRMIDAAGEPFLLLHGAEPDFRWEAFIEAVRQLGLAFGVRTMVSAHGIPMAVPHTRPVGTTRFASDPSRLEGHKPLFGQVKVPGSADALMHLRLGEAGLSTFGVAVHVPHYLAETQFGDAAVAALDAVMELGGLVLPTTGLVELAALTRGRIEEELANNDEAREIVQGLEERYDHFVEGQRRRSLLAEKEAELPSAEEIGAQLEAFLRSADGDEDERQDDRDDPHDDRDDAAPGESSPGDIPPGDEPSR
ncbi:PAC2 family protein [Ornithinimicrobium panacihumi]|uniref:PAC2 family protein n=1 Tax=Ornithinimicrobium panacihumi TaxID=2008449 RepID=UPI003F8C11CE